MQRYKHFLPPLALSFLLAWVYLASLAPGLSWAHFGADGGDLITAAATNGIAHPSGYPTYLLLARLFQFLPIGSLAYRTNLLSACCAIFAALILYFLTERSLLLTKPGLRSLIASISGLAFGLSPLFWSQALITEVYTLHLFFLTLILYLCFGLPQDLKTRRVDFLIGTTLGLALGNHLTSLLLLPVVLLAAPRNWKSLALRLAGIASGGLVYLILPLRALSGPPLNWGNPATLDGFFWLVSGQLYAGQLALLPWPALLERIAAIAGLAWGQFGLLGLALGMSGMVSGGLPLNLNRSLLWLAAGSVLFALVYTTSDSFLYLLPVILSFSVWIGAGLAKGSQLLSARWPRLAPSLAILFLIFLAGQTALNWQKVDASHDLRAEDFGEQVLAALPPNALVFARGDQAVFGLWYFHFGLKQRPDLVILSSDLLQFSWYLDSLRVAYPSLQINGSYLFESSLIAANPTRPNCTVTYLNWPQVYCAPR
ncbi:MAG: DUF2723 domain-containing protein [Anaerolineales bacterium]|jgi:hypothetical protein|nr:DUF2723 domain-containing protein [Anaerolineales bacterium]